MTACPACGHQIGVGRFCTNCGAPVESAPVPAGDWRTDTAERKLGGPVAPADPRTPPAATSPPPPPRYSLFADELDSWTPVEPVVDEPLPPQAPVDHAPVDQAPYLGPVDPDYDDPDYVDPDYDDQDYVYEEDDGRRTASAARTQGSAVRRPSSSS